MTRRVIQFIALLVAITSSAFGDQIITWVNWGQIAAPPVDILAANQSPPATVSGVSFLYDDMGSPLPPELIPAASIDHQGIFATTGGLLSIWFPTDNTQMVSGSFSLIGISQFYSTGNTNVVIDQNTPLGTVVPDVLFVQVNDALGNPVDTFMGSATITEIVQVRVRDQNNQEEIGYRANARGNFTYRMDVPPAQNVSFEALQIWTPPAMDLGFSAASTYFGLNGLLFGDVPEPGTLGLLAGGFGLAAASWWRRKRKS